MTPAVEVTALAVAFPDRTRGWRRVIDGVELHVNEGEVMGVVGESGSGKSLTMLALGGLLPEPGRVVGGKVAVTGVDVASADRAAMAALRGGVLGYVFQEPALALNPVRTVHFQITEAARLHGVISGRDSRRLGAELLGEVGLAPAGPMLDAYPHQLSGGQRQRVMLAAALSARPRVLIADEPTSALDTTAQADFLALLSRVRETRGMTLLFVSHQLALVARLGGRTTVVYAGETVEEAPTDELFRAPLHPYTRLLVGMMTPPARSAGAALPTIPGAVPTPEEWGTGCRFVARCPEAAERCRAARPALVDVGGGRRVRCFLHSDAEAGRE
ncbi:MAG: ABC transporter ATP-binding protein [Acidobacteriota bacterium]